MWYPMHVARMLVAPLRGAKRLRRSGAQLRAAPLTRRCCCKRQRLEPRAILQPDKCYLLLVMGG